MIRGYLMKDYKSMIASDSYLKPRKDPTQAQLRLYLREVNYHCPLCGKELQSRKQQKSNSLFEVAHIYPNSPTDEQYSLDVEYAARIYTAPSLVLD